MSVLGDIPVTNDLTSTNDVIPAGTMMHWGGTNDAIPTGWLPCAGQTLVNASYPALFAALGITFGGGGELGAVFKLPDLRGRTIVGPDNMGGSAAGRLTTATVGLAGGTQTHALTLAQIPSHSHSGVTGDMNQNQSHSHVGTVAGGWNAYQIDPRGAAPNGVTLSGSVRTEGADPVHEHVISNEGGGTAHENMMPYVVVLAIIKT